MPFACFWRIDPLFLLFRAQRLHRTFFAAKRDGIRPATNVRNMLLQRGLTAPSHGSAAIPEIPVYAWMITFTGMVRSSVIPIPIIPAAKPTINVSALNTLEISRLEAPMLRRIPISLVRSKRKYR